MTPLAIKNTCTNNPLPEKASPGSPYRNIYASEDILIPPGATRLIPTGIAVNIPDGYELQIRPDPSISLKTKLRIANAPGGKNSDDEIYIVVDNISRDYITVYWDGYRIQPMSKNIQAHTLDITGQHTHASGESEKNSNHGYYQIKKGDRIAQITLQKIEDIDWINTDMIIDDKVEKIKEITNIFKEGSP